MPVVCGNGVLQGDEECECASGTDCRFCSDCKLEKDKKCTPDSAAPCCDTQGNFFTTATSCTMPGGITGYCKAGVCATVGRCSNIALTTRNGVVRLDHFCGASSRNPCKAKCGSSSSFNACYDTTLFGNGGYNLADGAICMKDGQKGACRSGSCDTDVVCGNGIVQTGEACECASGTSCR